MSESGRPLVDDLLQAFSLVDSRLATRPESIELRAFRDRLAGELVGDAERVDATLASDFELVTYAGGARSVSGRDVVLESIRRNGTALPAWPIWVEFDHLVHDGSSLAAHGRLGTLSRAATDANNEPAAQVLSLTRIPVALFLTFAGRQMTSEVLFLDIAASESTTVLDDAIPTNDDLRARVEAPVAS